MPSEAQWLIHFDAERWRATEFGNAAFNILRQRNLANIDHQRRESHETQ